MLRFHLIFQLHMKSVNRINSALLAFLFLSLQLNAQTSRKDLERQRKQTEEQIALTKKILKETKNKKNKSLKELVSISRLIEKREELIVTINEEIVYVNSDVENKKDDIDSLNSQLDKEKKNYSKAIVQSYKNRKVYNNALYLFAAKSFNQLFQRLKFIQYLSEAQTRFLAKIEHNKNELEKRLSELIGLKDSKERLVKNKESELNELEQNKTQKNKAIISLTGKEKELKEQLDKQKKAKDNLNAQINAIIAKEIAEARKKAKAQASKTSKTESKSKGDNKTNPKVESKEPLLTPEAKELSDNFAANKGKLPWPVEKGFISERFGTHAHAKLDQVMIQNNGIDIQSVNGSFARCVYKGTVAAIISIPGMGKTVLVNHGEYFTVYSKLKNVTVSQGQILNLKQNIGTVDEDEDGATEIHFEIWMNQDKQNPEIWLAKK
ncbi:MAG: peptidoglycan DD-metalloendopeptidase family protein [bacterium]|nr:peptidoglycan DD-metalloendopeptidase family protein [bacterium]